MAIDSLKTVALFPGQGSQYLGMSRDLISYFPSIAKPFFDQASDILSFDLLKLTNEGPEDDLRLTMNTQPALLCHSLATFQVLKEEFGFEPGFFAGHSLGEYSALVAAEKLGFGDALKIVRKRGQAMQEAVAPGVGKMAAILGLDCPEVGELCLQVSSSGKGRVEVANDNCPGQVVVAGEARGVEELERQLTRPRVKFVYLPVSAPFHCSLMAPAAEMMKDSLMSLQIESNQKKIIANVDAKIYAESYSSDLLIKQIDHPVLWTDSLRLLEKSGASFGIEVGAGKVLCGLAKRTLGASFKTEATDKIGDFSGFSL